MSQPTAVGASADGAVAEGGALRPARLEARVVAFVVDGLVLASLLPVFLAFGGLTVLLQTDGLADDPSGREWLWGYLVGGLWLLTPLLYFTAGAMREDTVGARLLGLTVRRSGGDMASAPRPSGVRALARTVLLLLSAVALGLAFVGAVWDGRGRTLGDRATGTGVWEQAS